MFPDDLDDLNDLDSLLMENRPPPTPVEPSQFRTVLSHFASGVVVITGRDADAQNHPKKTSSRRTP